MFKVSGVAVLVLGGCTRLSPPGLILPCGDAWVKGSNGSEISFQQIAKSSKPVFFSCGCEACKHFAKEIAGRSGHWVCISSEEPGDLKKFLSETGWKGQAFTDPHERLAACMGALNCPAAFTVSPQGATRVSDGEAIKDLWPDAQYAA